MNVSAKRIIPPDDPRDRDGSNAQIGARPSNVVPLRRGSQDVESDDRTLLDRIRGGDEAAFRDLLLCHLSAVLGTARRIVRDETEAEDIAQEAFLRLWNRAGELDAEPHGLRPWLRRVASNLAIDHLRKAKRYDVTDDVPEQMTDPSQLMTLEATDAAQRVDQAIAVLPQRQRIAVSLFHFEEMSQRDIAATMEISEDALESLLARGRRRLRELLKDDWRELLTTGNES